jgi:hypothetical protein
MCARLQSSGLNLRSPRWVSYNGYRCPILSLALLQRIERNKGVDNSCHIGAFRVIYPPYPNITDTIPASRSDRSQKERCLCAKQVLHKP